MTRRNRLLRVLASVIFCVLIALNAQAQTARILVVGDSWTPAMVPCIQSVLDGRGLGDNLVVGGSTTISGTHAAHWATPGYLSLIEQELDNNPTIDIVHLSMGGNDYLGAVPGTPEALDALMEDIFDDIDIVVAHILSIRPDARIAWCSYDYVVDQGHNDALGRMVQEAIARAATNPDYYCINNIGLMHYTYGYPGEFGPGETPFPGGYPDYDPLMGGDPSLPGPPVALADSIHLTGAAYLVLAERCVEEFYADWLTGVEEPVPVGNKVHFVLLMAIFTLAGVCLVRCRTRAVTLSM